MSGHDGEPSEQAADRDATASQREPPAPWPSQLVCQQLLDTIDLATLPLPPASAREWRERAMLLCEDMPGLQAELANVPIGWFSLVERGMKELRARLPLGATFQTSQMKEKFGTLRWYGLVEDSVGGYGRDTGAEGATDWAETASERICAVYGTADGERDNSQPWLLTLSPEARALRAASQPGRGSIDLGDMMYPKWVYE